MKVDAAGAGQGKLHWAIHIADQIGMIGTAVLLRAVRDGRISLHISRPENALSFKDWARTTRGQPAVALIGDDDGLGGARRRGGVSLTGWCAGLRTSWCMPQALKRPHYQVAIVAAEAGARVFVIQTGPASAPSWLRVLAAIPRRQALVI